MLKIIDGSALAQKKRAEIKEEVGHLKEKGTTPGLAVVLVGSDAASQIYVNNKEKACHEVGFYSEIHRLSEDTSEEALLALIDQLNADPKIHGILVQLPVPAHINEAHVVQAIDVRKDVDGFLPENMGALLIGQEAFAPCTPKGCLALIKETGITISGKKAVVVGRSNIVGKPIAIMLLQENATVSICHSKTQGLKEELLSADIVVVAIGKANFIKAEMIKDGAVVIDVGMNRLETGKLAGDVEFSGFAQKDCWLTPVPGGVGPMTIAMLMENTLKGALRV